MKPKAIFDPPVADKSEAPRVVFAKWLTSPQNPRFANTIANRMWKKLFGVGEIEPVDDMKDDTVAENPELMTATANLMVRSQVRHQRVPADRLNTKTYQREATHGETDVTAYHFPGPILRRMTAEQVWDSFITLAAFDNPNAYHKPSSKGETSILSVDLTKMTGEQLLKRLGRLSPHTASGAGNAPRSILS